MATSMVDFSDHGCGFIGGLFGSSGFRSRKSSVHSLPSTTANSKNQTGNKKQNNLTEPVKFKPEKPVSPISKSKFSSPIPSISHNNHNYNHNHNQSRSSSISSSSTSQNSTIPRTFSGNILQLAQINTLKQKNSTLNNIYTNINRDHKNGTMGNIIRRSITDERLHSGQTFKMDPEELKILGNEKYKEGKYEESLRLYDKAIKIDSNVGTYRSNKSAALMGLGRVLEAVFECLEAVRIDPLYQRAHHRLGTLYFRLGDAEKAIQHYSQSGSIASIKDITQARTLEACLNRCNEAKELNNWGALLRYTHDALAIGATSSLQIFALQSQALLNLHRHDEAYSTFKKAPSFDMEFYSQLFGEVKTSFLYLIRTQVYLATGRFEDAIEASQKAARLDPTNKESKTMLIKTRSIAMARTKGNKLFKESKYFEASSMYSEGLEYDPYNSILLCNRAACRTKVGQFEKALEDCTLALSLQPSYSKARLRRAYCNAKMERWEASIQDYEILIREKPGDEEVGRALFEAKVQVKKRRGEDVKGMKFGSNVVSVSSIECFRHLITSPGMSVALFCSKTNQEKAVPLLEEVCLRFPSINFLKVEVEDHPYLAKSEEVTYVPAFKIYKNGSRIKDILGNNLQLLHSSITLYSK